MFPILNLQKFNYIHLINHFKISVAQHSFYFNVRRSPQVTQILRIFKKLGLIRRFYTFDLKHYRVYPTWAFNRNYLHHIKTHSHPKNQLRVSWKSLWILKQSIGCSTLILNTSRGLVTHREALKLREGGHLVCIIF